MASGEYASTTIPCCLQNVTTSGCVCPTNQRIWLTIGTTVQPSRMACRSATLKFDTPIARARFPVIDFHTHVSPRRAQRPAVPPADLVKAMDAVNLQTMVNLTGGSGEQLATTITASTRLLPSSDISFDMLAALEAQALERPRIFRA